jgi:amino acid adenylation domain-containing protein
MNAATLISELNARGIRLRADAGRLFYDAPDESALTPGLRQTIGARRDELIRLLAALPRQEQGAPSLAPLPAGAVAPVSFAQERFLFLDQLDGGGTTYNLSSLFHLHGALDRTAFAAALDDLCSRHSVLHTRFDLSTDPPTQHAAPAPALILIDAAGEPEPEAAAAAAAARLLGAPFDVLSGPHLRMALIRQGERHHLFAVAMHHIVSDGASIMVFVRELQALYAARLGAAAPPKPPALQFRDVAAWQRDYWTPARRAAAAAFWQTELSDAPARLQLPFGASRPAQPANDGFALSLPVPAALQAALEAASRQDGQTLFHPTLAAYALLLLTHGRQTEVVIGVPVANRPDPRLQDVIGPLVNLLPFRLRMDPDDTLGGFLTTTRRTAIRLMDHAELPFEHIVQALAPPRDPSHAPLLQAMFVLEDTPVGVMALPGLTVETAVVEDHGAKYEITLALQRRGQQLFCTWKSRASLIQKPRLARLGERYLHILNALLAAPATKLSAVTGLTPPEEAAAIAAGRGPRMAYPDDVTLHGLFAAQARATPHAVAIVFEANSLSYAALDAWSDSLAARLAEQGAGPGTVVAIHAERSLHMIAAVLGVLKSGAAYLPLEPGQPSARRNAMLVAAGIRLLVTHGDAPADLPASIATLPAGAPRPPAAAPPRVAAGPDTACAIFFTSGSTGQPKGVVLTHRAMAHNLLWMQQDWPLGADDTLLYKAAFGFDVSLKEMLWPLIAGARLVVATPGGQRDPAYLRRVIEAQRVTVVHLVPSMLDIFLQHGGAGCESLRIVMCGGEALSAALRDRFCTCFDALLLHLYGPTEAAIAVTASTWRAGDGGGPIRLGRPMPNCDVLVLDACLRPVPEGAVGEITIGGVPLALGYLGDGALTAARFVPHPYAAEPGARLYRTGDLGRRAEDGTIIYAGRLDRQVKHRGFRIEIGEIEAALRALPGVREGLVARRMDGEVPLLAAYVVAAGTPPASPDDIRSDLARTLPHYMVPDAICTLDAIPMNANGKADIDALPDPCRTAAAEPPPAEHADMPGNAVDRVRACWRAVMQRETIGAEENFFEAGGHSLMAMRLRARLAQAFDRPIAITDIFAYPTIAGFAAFLVKGGAAAPARAQVAPPAPQTGHNIAVIGMAGRFPGAETMAEFWRLLESGEEAIHRFTEAELLAAGIPRSDIAQPNYVPARGRLRGTENFDAAYFRISNRDADLLDPQIRLILEASHHALDDAGYDPGRLRESGQRLGVFASVSRSAYFLNRLAHIPGLMERVGPQQISVSTDKSFAATHLAYRLGLIGPAMTIDTACSSSLVAIHQACGTLRRGEADLMLVAAASVDVPMDAGYFFQAGNIAAHDGHCRPFDAQASGTVKGCGGGAILLKRLDDAQRDGDAILAVVRGSAVNNDGPAKVSFTAPSEIGQRRVIDAALADAGLGPDDIAYIEAHGTGTGLGDAIEFAALRGRYGAKTTFIGGVKASIGHLDAAAGLAGFIKTVLALNAGRIPPLVNFAAPHPALDLGGTAFRFPAAAQDWPADRPRRAAISSLGMGGTNAHVLLEAATLAPDLPADSLSLVRLSAASVDALSAMTEALARRLAEPGAPSLPSIAHTLATGRATHPFRAAFAADTTSALRRQLDDTGAAWRSDPPSRPREATGSAPIFLFGGHGSQHPAMGRSLYSGLAAFRDAADEALAAFAELGLAGLDGAFDPHEPESKRAARLGDHVTAQALIFTVYWAAARALIAHDLHPAACIGLSIGEVAAAAVAGCLPLKDAARLVIARARVIAACPGGMLQVAADPDQIARDLPAEADIAVIAGGAAVIAGPDDCLAALTARWEMRGARCRKLQVGHAAHSRLVSPHLPRFTEEIAGLDFRPPRIPVAANATGGWLGDAGCADAQYWARQLRETVRLDACFDTVLNAGPADAPVIEIGPGVSMLASIRRRLGGSGRVCLATMPGPRDPEPEPLRFLACLGGAWAAGLDPAFPEQVRDAVPRRARLPGYPFQRSRHFIDPPAGAPAASKAITAPVWTRLPPPPRRRAPLPGLAVCRRGPALDAVLPPGAEPGPPITFDTTAAARLLLDLTMDDAATASAVIASVIAHPALQPDDPRPVTLISAGAVPCLPGDATDARAIIALAALRAWLGARADSVIDLAPSRREADERALAAVLAEPSQGLVCLRGGHRHAMGAHPLATDAPLGAVPALRPGQRFLVIDAGGRSGAGVARALAASGAAHVCLAMMPGVSPRDGATTDTSVIDALTLAADDRMADWPQRFRHLAPLTGVVWAIGPDLPQPGGSPHTASAWAEGVFATLWPALATLAADADVRLVLAEGAAGNVSAACLEALCAAACAAETDKPWGLVRLSGTPSGLADPAVATVLLQCASGLGLPDIDIPTEALVPASTAQHTPPPPAPATHVPAGAEADIVAAIWSDILGADVTEDADFFALGGDSLAATHLLSRVNAAFGTAIPLAAFFRRPVFVALLALIRSHTGTIEDGQQRESFDF